MAKKKDKAGKLPKKVAGIKLPKQMRKSADKALALADNPLVRELAAAALVAGAAAITRRKTEKAEGVAKAAPDKPENDGATAFGAMLANGLLAAIGAAPKSAAKVESADAAAPQAPAQATPPAGPKPKPAT